MSPADLSSTLWFSVAILCLILLLRVLLRRKWAAVAAFVGVFALGNTLGAATNFPVDVPFFLAAWGMVAFVLIRFGLLAFMMWSVFTMSDSFPLTTDFSAWYAGRGLVCILLLLALASYGFYISLAGRPLFAKDLLQDQLEPT